MGSPILVTGGTGRLGRHVVSRLVGAGREVRVFSRHSLPPADAVEYATGDLLKDDGIEAAVNGCRIVVHCAGGARGDDEATRNLARAASRAGVEHLVYISVVGADRVPVVGRTDRAVFRYFAMKRVAEDVVAGSGIPWTTLRATQFHGSFLAVAQAMTKLPLLPVPAGFRFQPVDESEVASWLAELALGAPGGLVPEMAGPRVLDMADLLRAYLRASGKRRVIVPLPIPGHAARAIRAGANLAPDRAVGKRTWEDFLADRLGVPGRSSSVPV